MTSEVSSLMPVQTAPAPNDFDEMKATIVEAVKSEKKKEKIPPLSPDAQKCVYWLKTFDSRHKNIIFLTDNEFADALFEDHDEEDFKLLRHNIVAGTWTNNNIPLLKNGLANCIGRWHEEEKSGVYLVWAEKVDYQNGRYDPFWCIYYQHFEASSTTQAVARVMKGNGGN